MVGERGGREREATSSLGLFSFSSFSDLMTIGYAKSNRVLLLRPLASQSVSRLFSFFSLLPFSPLIFFSFRFCDLSLAIPRRMKSFLYIKL